MTAQVDYLQISELDLSHKNLTILPDLSKYTNLEKLYCSNNKLTIIPILNNLEELNLYISVHIFDRSFIFDYKKELVKCIETFDNTKFLEYFEKLILNSNEYIMIGIDTSI